MSAMNERRLADLLSALAQRRVAVLGDFCVDRYLHIDPAIIDHSNETGLPIHQVVAVRPEPGGGGNVVHNVAALRVGEVCPVGLLGLDGEGFELGRIFDRLGVKRNFLRYSESRHTPVYMKPLVVRAGQPPEELNRFDVFPRTPLAPDEENALIADLRAAFDAADALIVADYTEAGKEGVVTDRVRNTVADLARAAPDKPVLADSRLHIDRFREVVIKPNAHEALTYLGPGAAAAQGMVHLLRIAQEAAERNKRPVLVTLGADGVLLCAPGRAQKVPAYPSEREGPIDIVGAGDTVLAAVAAALAAGATLDEAAIVGMLAASVTIQQIGTCGTASPDQLLARFRQYAAMFPDVVGQ